MEEGGDRVDHANATNSSALLAGNAPPTLTKRAAMEANPALNSLALFMVLMDRCCQTGSDEFRKVKPVSPHDRREYSPPIDHR